MKKYYLIIFAVILLTTSLACNALAGGNEPQVEPLPPVDSGDGQPSVTEQSQEPTEQSGDSSFSVGDDSEFPMFDDATNVVNVAGVLTYQTRHNIDEVIEFYRDTLTSQGYAEREINTSITDAAFNLVFDGHESGQALVIQGVDLGGGNFNVSIFLQDM